MLQVDDGGQDGSGYCMSLFVVCRYLPKCNSRQISTPPNTSRLALRAVSRHTPYFASISFSSMASNSWRVIEFASISDRILAATAWRFVGFRPRFRGACGDAGSPLGAEVDGAALP